MNNNGGNRRSFLAALAGGSLLADSVIAQTSTASATGLPTRVLGRAGNNGTS